VTAQTAAVPPDSPSAPTVLGSNRTSVSIRWDAPEADGGSAVTSYEVELRPKSKAGLAGMTDEWLTVYQVGRTHPYALSEVLSLLQHDLPVALHASWQRQGASRTCNGTDARIHVTCS